jgi:hypothetical protein
LLIRLKSCLWALPSDLPKTIKQLLGVVTRERTE